MREERIRVLRAGRESGGPVLYWMSRDQRAIDNDALVFAGTLALERKAPLAAVFCLQDRFLGATERQYGFMLRGLEEVKASLGGLGVPFFLLRGEPGEVIPRFAGEEGVSAVVADFDPLRIKRRWKESVRAALDIPFYEVDAHNVVPCFAASGRQEYAARTFRPKVLRVLDDYLEEYPPPPARHPFPWKGRSETAWSADELLAVLPVDRGVREVRWIRPGTRAGMSALGEFVKERLESYPLRRNDPVADGQSGLSPYLHFGQISPRRVALAAAGAAASPEAKKAFLEEAVVRRELSDNFCFFNDRYDSLEGAPGWARKTLDDHRKDRRPWNYGPERLEGAATHDPLWNAAQMEMVKTGKMHGYLRMYWAKKILEWTAAPEEALRIAVDLNDRYELDGRDPNGYTGCLWSVGGLHDRAWPSRPVFGNIRYMNDRGARRKFDGEAYIRKVEAL